MNNQALCEELIRADTEKEVELLLMKADYWDNIDFWAAFGDNSANASVIGAQQADAESALVEKIVNSIDARLLNACQANGYNPHNYTDLPQTGQEAICRWFEHGLNTDQISRAGNIAAWYQSKINEQAEQITVTATGARGSFASITIVDTGEGQEPDCFGDTFCSLNTGNKRSVPFVQGKHTMGGTGALRFCGAGRVRAHNLQLIVSRRNPAYASKSSNTPWGFTVVRKFPAQGNEKTPTYRYLAPGKQVLHFEATELAIFPQVPPQGGKAEPYARFAPWGTLTKLYEYIKATYITESSSRGKLTLLRKLELRIPQATLPVKLYECRGFRSAADAHPTIVLMGIMNRLTSLPSRSEYLEWDGTPKKLEFRVDSQLFQAIVWAFKSADTAKRYRGAKGVLFMLNGQTHAILDDRFFSRKTVDLDALRKSLLVVVDCSAISKAHEMELIMNSRDRLAESEFRNQVENELATRLKEHPALQRLRNERIRYSGAADQHQDRAIRDFLESHLQTNPDLSKLLFEGSDISNPHKPFTQSDDQIQLRNYPTYFRLRKATNGYLRRDAHLDRGYHRFIFETDACDNYFDRLDSPGIRALDINDDDNLWTNADNYIEGWHLSDGTAEMRLRLPDNTHEGDIIDFKFTVSDDNPDTLEEFVSHIRLDIKSPNQSTHGNPDNDKSKSRPVKVDLPEIKRVGEEDWNIQSPEPFDAHTALRRFDLAEGRYEFRYNAANKWLRHYVQSRRLTDGQAENLTKQFGQIISLFALAVMANHKQQEPEKGNVDNSPDSADGGVSAILVNDLVDWFTSAIAPVVSTIDTFTSSPLVAADPEDEE